MRTVKVKISAAFAFSTDHYLWRTHDTSTKLINQVLITRIKEAYGNQNGLSFMNDAEDEISNKTYFVRKGKSI